jgi:hypothetical protein
MKNKKTYKKFYSNIGLIDPDEDFLYCPVHQFLCTRCGQHHTYKYKEADPILQQKYIEFKKQWEKLPLVDNKQISKVDLKDYSSKLPLSQIQWKAIANDRGVLGVYKFAQKKYGNILSWRNRTPDSVQRYTDALIRHLLRILDGEVTDPESKLPHMAHLCWNALTILEFMIEDDLATVGKRVLETPMAALSKQALKRLSGLYSKCNTLDRWVSESNL